MYRFTTISFPELGLEMDPVRQISVGPLSIHLYGLIIGIGMILAVSYGMRRAKEFGLTEDHILDGFLWVMPFAVLCARLYYCLFSWDYYSQDPIQILYIWEGGLAIYGGIIGGALAMLLARRFGMKLVKALFPKQDIENLAIFRNPDRLRMLTFLLFLIPGTPKDLLSYFVALTKIKLSTWLLIVVVSRIPSVVTSTVGGSALGMENYVFAIVTFAVTLVVSGIGVLIYNRIRRGREE